MVQSKAFHKRANETKSWLVSEVNELPRLTHSGEFDLENYRKDNIE